MTQKRTYNTSIDEHSLVSILLYFFQVLNPCLSDFIKYTSTSNDQIDEYCKVVQSHREILIGLIIIVVTKKIMCIILPTPS